MDEQYQNINTIIDEILGVFYMVVPIFIIGSITLIFKDELLLSLLEFHSNLFN